MTSLVLLFYINEEDPRRARLLFPLVRMRLTCHFTRPHFLIFATLCGPISLTLQLVAANVEGNLLHFRVDPFPSLHDII